MNDRWQSVKDAFHEALEREVEDRDAFLEERCAGDPDLLAEVRGLLDAYTVADSDRIEAGEEPGDHIGRYKLLELIGEGGFGSVYMAEQTEPVHRRVALKVIKLGMDTRQVIARFEAERQALAVMDHPNIARVLDAGATEGGRPFFVMELVRGTPITKYCDQARLGTNDRLRLFQRVCSAVQHAHQKGIIHRDIKPSNVLVTLHDGEPVPKVIDFGIAKATDHKLTQKTLFTRFRQMVGTPEYMAPEQAEMSGLDVDTRADIYSLGVLLYELLTGTKPFELTSVMESGFDAVLKQIREVDPPKPSTRLSSLGIEATSLASMRGVNRVKLRSELRGDLDWIVMRALEKDRARRYETANSFAEDIQRHLDDQPVLAGPPSSLYRLKKAFYRNRVPFVTVASVMLALAAGTVIASVGFLSAVESQEAEQAARVEEQRMRVLEQEARKEAVAQRDNAERERLLAAERAEALRLELYASHIEQIQRILATGGGEDVKRLLDACDPDLRGWEWERLRWLADRSERKLELASGVRDLSCTRDGSLLVLAQGNEAHVYQALTLSLKRRLQVEGEGPVTCVAISADGRRAAAGTKAGTLHVWGLETGELLRRVEIGSHILACALDAEGKRAALGTNGETMIVDVTDGTRVVVTDAGMGRAVAVRFLPGDRLLTGSLANDLGVADARSGEALSRYRGAGFVVRSVDVDREGRVAVSVGDDARLFVRDLHTGELLGRLPVQQRGPGCAALHPGGRLAAVSGTDGRIVLYDLREQKVAGELRGHVARVNDVEFHADGYRLFSADSDGVVRVWHLGALLPETRLVNYHGLTAVDFSADSREVLFGGHDTILTRYSLDDLSRRLMPTGQPRHSVGYIVTSPSGEWTAAQTTLLSDHDSRLIVLDRYGQMVYRLPGDHAPLSFSPGGERFLDGAGDVRASRTGEVVTGGLAFSTFLHDGRIARADEQRGLVVHDGGDYAELSVLPLALGPPERLHAARDRALVVVVEKSGRVHVVDLDGGAPPQAFTVEGEWNCTALSPDGTRLVSGGPDSAIRLWNTATGRQVMTVGCHPGAVRAVAFSPDGRSIAASGSQHVLSVYETGPPYFGFDGRAASVAGTWRLTPAGIRAKAADDLAHLEYLAGLPGANLEDLLALVDFLVGTEVADMRDGARALEVARECVTREESARTLQRRADALQLLGDEGQALASVRRALDLLTPEQEPLRAGLMQRLGALAEAARDG